MRILGFFLLSCLVGCSGRMFITLDPEVTLTPINIANVVTTSVREGRWAIVDVTGVDGATVTGTSSDGLIFAGNKTRLNVKANSSGVLTGLLTANLNGATDTENLVMTILPGYPEIEITQFTLDSGNIYNISGQVSHSEFLGTPTDYKIIACLHADIYYCQNLALLAPDGTFTKVGQNFFGGFALGDRVQFILTHSSVTPSNLAGTGDTYVETNSRYSVWKAMDGTDYINFKNYYNLNPAVHANLQIQHLMSRLGKFEQTAGIASPASPARFIRSYLDSDQFFLYDQALAVMAFTHANQPTQAKTVLNAFKNHWQAHGSAGWWYFSYNHDNSGSIYPADGDRRMAGSIAWVSMAINYYKKEFPSDTDYDLMAKSAIEYLKNETQAITVNGITSVALRFNPTNIPGTAWDETDTISMEHNLDLHSALASFVVAYPADPSVALYNTLKADIRSFLDSLWIPSEKRFYPGANISTGLANSSEIYLDTQSWGTLALGATYKDGLIKNCDLFFESAGHLNGGTAGHLGFYDFRANNGAAPLYRFVWSEGTAGQILAMNVVQSEVGTNLSCNGLTRTDLLNALGGVANADGGVPYSTQTTNDSFTTSSSVAGTAWLYFANVGFNPFRP